MIPSDSIGWMRDGETLLARAAGRAMPFAQPSLLPGWTRERVLSHLAGNAVALLNLLHWARTGQKTPMYADAQARDAEIDRWCGVDAATLLDHVDQTRQELDDTVRELPDGAWHTEVQTNSGRVVAASFVPWMRVREVYIHAADLDCGVTFGDVPADVRTAMIDEIVPTLSVKAQCPSLDLSAADQTWHLGGGGDAVHAADSARLLAWLTGRSAGTDLDSTVEIPALPRWL